MPRMTTEAFVESLSPEAREARERLIRARAERFRFRDTTFGAPEAVQNEFSEAQKVAYELAGAWSSLSQFHALAFSLPKLGQAPS